MGEVGIVTMLFTDLVGSTELLDRLGEDAAEDLRRTHFRLLREQVAHRSGREVKNLGDGLMLAFESSTDAVGCAVDMQRAVEHHNRTNPAAPLHVRIGLHVGEPIRDEGDYFGLPVVVAQRLCNEAAGGQILASELVADLVGPRGSYTFQFAGPAALKGLAEPVTSYEVRWQPQAGECSDAPPLPKLLVGGDQFAFAGRARELDVLVEAWKRAAEGQRQTVLLGGEPGIGKTRLAAEFAARAHRDGATVLYGRCDEDMNVPFQPFVEALRFFVAHVPPHLLSQQVGRHGAELARLVPELAEHLHGLPPSLHSDPETERYRLFDAISEWLAAASGERPLVLVLDDLHWGEKPTLLLLRHAIRTEQRARLLVVGTYRDAEIDRARPFTELLADLRRLPGVERLSLRGLDEAGVVELLERAAGHAMESDGLELARTIHLETEGNPFFASEVIRHLAESGAIYADAGRWTTDRPIAEMGIPDGIREVIMQRLVRLSEPAKRLLRVGAVIGRDFRVGDLEEVVDADEDALIDALEEAVAARVLDETGPDGYRFSHVLVRSTLYELLSSIRRSRLHRQIAEVIERRRPDDVATLAYHYGSAGELTKAVEFTALAAERAVQQLAHDEAAALYARARSLFDQIRGGDPVLRCELLLRLGDARRLAGDPAYRETLLEAAAAAKALDDTDRLVRAALSNDPGWVSAVGDAVDRERIDVLEAALRAVGEQGSDRARLLARMAAELMFAGDRPRRLEVADEALTIARRVDDKPTLSYVLAARFQAILGPDTLTERVANTTEQLALAEEIGDPFMYWYGRFAQTRCRLESGDLENAGAELDELSRLAGELNQPFPRWATAVLVAGQAQFEGRLEEAERLTAEALEVGQQGGMPDASNYFAGALVTLRWDQGRLGELAPVIADTVARSPQITAFRAVLALAYTEVDNDDEARRMLERDASDNFAAFPMSRFWLSGTVAYAEVCARVAATDAAPILYERLAPFHDQIASSNASAFGLVARYLGLLASTMGRFDEAEARFEQAAALHRRVGAPGWLARTQLDHARLLVTRNGPDDATRARALVDEASASAGTLPLGVTRARTAALLAG